MYTTQKALGTKFMFNLFAKSVYGTNDAPDNDENLVLFRHKCVESNWRHHQTDAEMPQNVVHWHTGGKSRD